MKVNVNVKTRISKAAPIKATVLTMDYTGLTVADLIPPAQDSLVITLQSRWRRAKVIPQTLQVNVKELLASLGSRQAMPVTVEGIAATAETMSKADREALMAKLKAMEGK